MKFLLLMTIAMLLSPMLIANSEEHIGKVQNAHNTPSELRKKLDAYMGGIVEKPGSSKGWVCIANAQNILPEDSLKAYISLLRQGIKLETRVIELSDEFSVSNATYLAKGTGANATLFVVEDDALPFSLIAPDSGWAVVNVKAVVVGTLPRIGQERIKKAIIRAYSILCGAYDPGTAGNILWPISEPEDYDALQNPSVFPPTLGGPICAHMSRAGMSPIIFSSYRKACEAGWAASPTNDVQRTIWEQTHQLPSKSITIEFDPARGK